MAQLYDFFWPRQLGGNRLLSAKSHEILMATWQGNAWPPESLCTPSAATEETRRFFTKMSTADSPAALRAMRITDTELQEVGGFEQPRTVADFLARLKQAGISLDNTRYLLITCLLSMVLGLRARRYSVLLNILSSLLDQDLACKLLLKFRGYIYIYIT